MLTTRRHFVRILGMTGLGGAAVSLASCEEQMWDDLARELDGDRRAFGAPESSDIDFVTHVLNRLTWGPHPEEYTRVAEMGPDAFIEEQLNPEAIGEPRRASWKVMSIESISEPRAELFNEHPQRLIFDLTRAKLLRATYSSRQLYEVMVDFWTDHFNIVSAKGQCKWLKIADDREVIRKHALGNFAEMVRASALSPAMLIYLDGHDNKVRQPEDKPNENYARELLELHTLGVHGGYTQDDVMEAARCLSGWTYGHSFLAPDTVRFVPENHDDGAKVVLGERIERGGGEQDVDRVIEIVCAHPSTAHHIAHKLCRTFIADDPSGGVVSRVADTFARSSGDIRATLRSLFTSDDFRSTRGTLFKRPFRYVVSALRATDAAADASEPLQRALERMGHSPFQYPTPDGYPIEPQPWFGTLLWRWNLALQISGNRFDGVTIRKDEWMQRFGTPAKAAAFLSGRALDENELDAILSADDPLAVALSSPAFHWH